MKNSIVKNLLVFSVVLWVLSGCGGSVTTTSKQENQPVNADVTLQSNLTNINHNADITLSWSSVGATDCVASGDWSGNKSVSGSEVINQLTEDSTFILSCTNDNETVSDTVQVYVGAVVLPTLTFSTSSSTVNINSSTTLSWSTTNATECTASGDWSGSKATSGSEVISSITSDSTFNLSCNGPGGDANDSVNVTVVSIATPTVSLTASAVSVSYNGSTRLTWNSTNTSSCTASGGWSGTKAISGSKTIRNLTTNEVFTLSCSGTGGSASESVSVTVQSAPAPTVALSASPSTVSQGGSTTLSWSSSNATSCIASGDWSGTKGTSGSQSISSISSASQYTLDCSGSGGSASDSVDVTVTATPVPTVSLSAAPSTVSQGGSTTLSWSSTNATSCIASGNWSGTKGTSGSQSISSISSASQYSLNCSGAGGSASESVDVSVTATPVPTVSLSAAPSTVSQGGSTTLIWSSTNASSCIASGDWSGSKGVSGSETINSINVNSQFTLDCSGTGGSADVTVNVSVVMSNVGTALLSWTPPAENTDGTALTDLAGYRIYYGTQSGNYSESIEIANPGITSYLIENLGPATWHFVMTSYTDSNIESAYSTEASKTIN